MASKTDIDRSVLAASTKQSFEDKTRAKNADERRQIGMFGDKLRDAVGHADDYPYTKSQAEWLGRVTELMKSECPSFLCGLRDLRVKITHAPSPAVTPVQKKAPWPDHSDPRPKRLFLPRNAVWADSPFLYG